MTQRSNIRAFVLLSVLLITAAATLLVYLQSQRTPPPEHAAAPALPTSPDPSVLIAAHRAAHHELHPPLVLALATARIHDASRAPEAAVKQALLGAESGALDAFPEALLDLASEPIQARRRYAELLIEAQAYRAAREQLWAIRDRVEGEPEWLTPLLHQSFDADPRFVPEVATLGPSTLDRIERLGGGTSLTFRFYHHGEKLFAFKPYQQRYLSNYRSEIAAWRLCELLHCAFSIPYNRAVRIEKSDFFDLYAMRSRRQKNYAQRFDELRWKRTSGRRYLYGTEKAWVPEFVRFPIEHKRTWKPWLSATGSPQAREQPLAEALAPWKENSTATKLLPQVLEQAGGLTTRELAHQISDMLLFDFLIGNWDRMTVEPYWGINCQFGRGQLISIDNGVGFPSSGGAGEVERRFRYVEVFSRSLIRELRRLDKERTLTWLYPNARRKDRRRFDNFWRKRGIVLERVDALIAEHGEERVLVFE